eukprot:5548648-Prymnesium_polylepis.1
MFSDGKSHAQRMEPAGAPPGPSTCVYPTEAQADALARELKARELAAVSIGAGDGYLEGQLERRDVDVTAVDVAIDAGDTSIYASIRCFCSEIVRVRAYELFRIAEPATSALLFVWGRALPWREYLANYPQVPLVIIVGDPAAAGDGCMTEPSATALVDAPGWKLLWRAPVAAIHPTAITAAYLRVPTETGASAAEATGEAAAEATAEATGDAAGAAAGDVAEGAAEGAAATAVLSLPLPI